MKINEHRHLHLWQEKAQQLQPTGELKSLDDKLTTSFAGLQRFYDKEKNPPRRQQNQTFIFKSCNCSLLNYIGQDRAKRLF